MIAVRHLTILGSTGSIGVSTLDVVSRHPDRFRIVALAANKSAKKMLEQCRSFQPRYAVLLEEASAEWLRAEVHAAGLATEVLCGVESLEKVASLAEVDTVMAAIVGAAGIRRSVSAISAELAGAGNAGAGMRSSQLGNGAEDFGRLRYHDEQGAGSYRGALAV